MDKPIETIWKEAFKNDNRLLVPKLNNLYSQKSANIIDQLIRMFKINLVAIGVFSALLFVVALFLGVPFLGASLALLLSGLVVKGNRELNRLVKIDKGVSSYQYLKAFDAWLKEKILGYTRIYRFFYPVFFLTFVIGIWFSRFGESIKQKMLSLNPAIYLVNDIPVFWFLGAVLLSCFLGYFAGVIYQIDINLVYGRVFKKLDEILADMEELSR